MSVKKCASSKGLASAGLVAFCIAMSSFGSDVCAKGAAVVCSDLDPQWDIERGWSYWTSKEETKQSKAYRGFKCTQYKIKELKRLLNVKTTRQFAQAVDIILYRATPGSLPKKTWDEQVEAMESLKQEMLLDLYRNPAQELCEPLRRYLLAVLLGEVESYDPRRLESYLEGKNESDAAGKAILKPRELRGLYRRIIKAGVRQSEAYLSPSVVPKRNKIAVDEVPTPEFWLTFLGLHGCGEPPVRRLPKIEQAVSIHARFGLLRAWWLSFHTGRQGKLKALLLKRAKSKTERERRESLDPYQVRFELARIAEENVDDYIALFEVHAPYFAFIPTADVSRRFRTIWYELASWRRLLLASRQNISYRAREIAILAINGTLSELGGVKKGKKAIEEIFIDPVAEDIKRIGNPQDRNVVIEAVIRALPWGDLPRDTPGLERFIDLLRDHTGWEPDESLQAMGGPPDARTAWISAITHASAMLLGATGKEAPDAGKKALNSMDNALIAVYKRYEWHCDKPSTSEASHYRKEIREMEQRLSDLEIEITRKNLRAWRDFSLNRSFGRYYEALGQMRNAWKPFQICQYLSERKCLERGAKRPGQCPPYNKVLAGLGREPEEMLKTLEACLHHRGKCVYDKDTLTRIVRKTLEQHKGLYFNKLTRILVPKCLDSQTYYGLLSWARSVPVGHRKDDKVDLGTGQLLRFLDRFLPPVDKLAGQLRPAGGVKPKGPEELFILRRVVPAGQIASELLAMSDSYPEAPYRKALLVGTLEKAGADQARLQDLGRCLRQLFIEVVKDNSKLTGAEARAEAERLVSGVFLYDEFFGMYNQERSFFEEFTHRRVDAKHTVFPEALVDAATSILSARDKLSHLERRELDLLLQSIKRGVFKENTLSIRTAQKFLAALARVRSGYLDEDTFKLVEVMVRQQKYVEFRRSMAVIGPIGSSTRFVKWIVEKEENLATWVPDSNKASSVRLDLFLALLQTVDPAERKLNAQIFREAKAIAGRIETSELSCDDLEYFFKTYFHMKRSSLSRVLGYYVLTDDIESWHADFNRRILVKRCSEPWGYRRTL